MGIKPHSGVAELGAWPVAQQDWTVLCLAWGRHFCTAHQISSQPGLGPGVQYVSCQTLFSLNHGVLPGLVTCFNLESALEVMLRMKQALCSFWCPGWTQSSEEPRSKCGHIHVPWPKDTWERGISRRRPAHVPGSQHHKQQHGRFFKALTFGVGYYSLRAYQNTCLWEKGKRWGNKWY